MNVVECDKCHKIVKKAHHIEVIDVPNNRPDKVIAAGDLCDECNEAFKSLIFKFFGKG